MKARSGTAHHRSAREARQEPHPAVEAQRNRRARRSVAAHARRQDRDPQSLPHASEARDLRRIGFAASAARVRLHGLPSRPGSRDRVRPRRPYADEQADGESLAEGEVPVLPRQLGLQRAQLGIRGQSVPRDADVSAAVHRGGMPQVPRRADGSGRGRAHQQG